MSELGAPVSAEFNGASVPGSKGRSASSLSSVSGEKESARQVAGSVNKFLGTVSSAYPAGSAVSEALTKGAVALYDRFAKDRAARSVAEALSQADPAVHEVADILAQDFKTMRRTLRTLRNEEEIAYVLKAKADDPQVAYVQSQRDEVAALRGRLASEPSLLGQFTATQDAIDKEQARPGYVKYLAGLREIDERYDRYAAVVDQAADLTRAWGQSHSKLIEASRAGRSPPFTVLVEMTREMLQIYREAKQARQAEKEAKP